MTVPTYDIVMLVVLLAATAFGALKGLAWQVASLVAIIASYAMAYHFRHAVAAWIPVAAPWRIFLAMLLLYVVSSLGIWIIFRLLSKVIDRMRLRELDRQMGALLGFGKGLLLCVIITLFAVTLLGEKQRASIVKSHSGYYIAVLLDQSRAAIPAEVHDVLGPVLDALDARIEQAAEGRSEQGGAASSTAPKAVHGLPVSLQ